MIEEKLTWRKLTIIRILFMICNWLAEDAQTQAELKATATHISIFRG